MRGQANQHHLALTAATLPRQPHLVPQGWGNCHWGPAILPPSLPHEPSIADCIYFAPDLNGANVQMIWVKAIVYLPMLPTNIRVSKIRQYIYLLLILGLESPQVYSLPSHVGRSQSVSQPVWISLLLWGTDAITDLCTHMQHCPGAWEKWSSFHIYTNKLK